MGSNYAPNPGPAIDTATRPQWCRTGDTNFPYAAHQAERWWLLRRNHGFPEHDMYTLFVDGQAPADITAAPPHRLPSPANIAAPQPAHPDPAIPMLDADTAASVVDAVARYADYGSEHGNPCMFCSNSS